MFKQICKLTTQSLWRTRFKSWTNKRQIVIVQFENVSGDWVEIVFLTIRKCQAIAYVILNYYNNEYL